MQDLRNRIDRAQAKIDAIDDEHGSNVESEAELRRLPQLEKKFKTDLANTKKEVAALEKQAKNKQKNKGGLIK